MYYLRTKSAVDAIKFTLTNKDKAAAPKVEAPAAASVIAPESKVAKRLVGFYSCVLSPFGITK
jgi:hypothetical protein